MKKSLITLIICISLSSLAWAEAPEKIAELEARLAQLEARITQLETQLAALQPAPAQPKAPQGIPEEIDQAIRQKAAERYPENYSTQEAYIKMQRESYQFVQGMTAPKDVPAAVFKKILSQARNRYPENYSTQETYIKMQVDSYLKLQQ